MVLMEIFCSRLKPIQNLLAHLINLCSGVFCKCLGDFGVCLEGIVLFFFSKDL